MSTNEEMSRNELVRKCITLCIQDRHSYQDAVLTEDRTVPGTLPPDMRGTTRLKKLRLAIMNKLRVRK